MHLDVRMKAQGTVFRIRMHFYGVRNKKKHGLSFYCFAAGAEDAENYQIFSPSGGVTAQSRVWVSCICCYIGWLSLGYYCCLQTSWSSVCKPSVSEVKISEEEQWVVAACVFA